MLSSHSMKTLVILGYAVCSLAILGGLQVVRAEDAPILYQPDPDSPIGERNPDGPAELAQYDFLIGDWDVDITWYFDPENPSQSKAKWHNHWIVNGNVVMLEWRGPQFTGAEIRQWDAGKNQWFGVNVYPDFGPHMTPVTSYKEGDSMLVFMDVKTADGDYINRETYYDIQPDSYKMKSDHSYDGGETWVRGLYEMTVTRAKK